MAKEYLARTKTRMARQASQRPVKSVLISGAGIAGPTLAYWLTEYGFSVTLMERAPRLRTGGYIIDFWGAGYDVADRMRLGDDLLRRGYRVEELRFVDSKGNWVGGFKVDVIRKITDSRFTSLPRGDLVELIFRKIESRCEVIFGDGITSIEQYDDRVAIKCEHAPPRSFDIVVGADGFHSTVRALAFGDDDFSEKYLGYGAAAFEAKGYRPRDEGVYVSFSLPGKQVARFAMRDDRTMFLFVFSAPKATLVNLQALQAQKLFLQREYAQAGWECPLILDALEQCEELYFDRVSQIRMRSWSRGRVVLVGDSAFCPSLLAGQGAALAMIASYVLARELAKAPDRFQQAFGCYEDLMHSFIISKQMAAEQFAGSLVPKTTFGLFLRNQISKTLGFPLVAKLVFGRGLVDRISLP